MQRCPVCLSAMIEKPLFTSFYWECPSCDGVPKQPDPCDPMPWEMPNWSDLKSAAPQTQADDLIFNLTDRRYYTYTGIDWVILDTDL